tara:strand:+ start:168 stop:449 length:282 start_codon:yes stop_codon:yes gene_type:complete
MITFAIVLFTILLWASSNVCKYNFVIEKKTNQLNMLMSEIDPSIPNAKVYYFKELNCDKISLSWDYERILINLEIITVVVYQMLTTDLKGNPN